MKAIYHAVYLDEWVRVRNLMNTRFHACSPCSICKTVRCAPVWYSVKTREVRCLKCFDAETEHDRREFQRPLPPHCAGGEFQTAQEGEDRMTETYWLSFANEHEFGGVVVVDLNRDEIGNEKPIIAAVHKALDLGIDPGNPLRGAGTARGKHTHCWLSVPY